MSNEPGASLPVNSATVIETQGLTRRFGDFLAVDHVSFQVFAGEVVGYLGPNGSGKTTTMRMLLGLLRPTEGSARVLGFDADSQSEQVRARVGYMSQSFPCIQISRLEKIWRFMLACTALQLALAGIRCWI